MKKILLIIFIVCSINSYSQNTQTIYTNVLHGDTAFVVKTVNSFSLDSTFRTEYQYHDQRDSVLVSDTMRWVCVTITDSVQYWYKYRTFTGSVKDSVQNNKYPHKTINSNAITGSGDLSITGSAAWGSVSGNISDQTDLTDLLSEKVPNTRTVNGQALSGDISLTKTDVGLSNADNTSDANKPVSAAQQTALNGKQNTISLTTTGTSGAATFVGSTLNIPNYATGGGGAPTFLNLASNFSSTSTTPAAVTGWSFSVTSGKTYRITVIADYQTAATTTGGKLGISLTTATGTVRGFAAGAVSQSAVATELKIPIRATSGTGSTLTTSGVSVINSPHYIGLDITFTCTGTGTFNIVWGTEVASSAAQLNANSSLIYQALN